MRTRLLESNEVLRVTVTEAKLAETGPAHLLLSTAAASKQDKPISSADSEMMELAKRAQEGGDVPGRVRIDFLTDTIFRVRYAEHGHDLPEQTPMIVGRFDGPTCFDTQRHDDRIEATTAAVKVTVHLSPYRIEVRDLDGGRLCGIGGPEKNAFNKWDSFNTGICRGCADGGPVAVESFDLDPREAVYGLGEQFLRLNKVGQTIDLDMIDALGVISPRSYKNVPFYVSTRGYGVLFNHSSLMTYWIGAMSAVDVQVAAEDDFLDYFVILGDLKALLSQYQDLTGRGEVPPKWTFGYWQSKITYKSAEETLDIARKLREHDVPCDVIHLDTFWFKEDWYCNLTFDADRFPDPKAYLAELAEMGFKVSLWQLPYIPEGSPLFDELKAVDGFVKTGEGEIYDVGICFTPGFKGIVGCVDYTHPRAVEVHQSWFAKLFELGAKVIKTDFGESAPLDGVYHDGTPGHRMHNLYPLLYNRAVFDVTKRCTGDGVVWARSAWAGSQRYPLHWGGDNSPNWANLIPQLEGGLSFGLTGFSFWSQDIGGFLGAPTHGPLLIRWMQIGMFCSHSRIHGYGDRELYKFPEPALSICRDYIRLRYRLMPYIYGSAIDCVARALPMVRALVIEYQDDPTTWSLSDEYLFGESLLVAPISDESGRRRVYFPRGTWTDWWTGRRVTGPTWEQIEAPLEQLPLYVREGGIVPMGPAMSYVDEKPTDEIELRIGPFAGDGRSMFHMPIGDRLVSVEYVAEGGKHGVRTDAPGVAFAAMGIDGTKISMIHDQ